jgi:hypothetical protein
MLNKQDRYTRNLVHQIGDQTKVIAFVFAVLDVWFLLVDIQLLSLLVCSVVTSFIVYLVSHVIYTPNFQVRYSGML